VNTVLVWSFPSAPQLLRNVPEEAYFLRETAACPQTRCTEHPAQETPERLELHRRCAYSKSGLGTRKSLKF
jgi:hypothetical protein